MPDPMTTTPRTDPLAFLGDEVAALRERHLYRAAAGDDVSAQGPIVVGRRAPAHQPVAPTTTSA